MSEQQNIFSLGQASGAANDKKKTLTAQQQAEKRMQDNFAAGATTEETRRGRENFAVALRDKRKNEYMRDKRQRQMASNSTTPGQTPSSSQAFMNMELSVESALQQKDSISLEQFTTLVNQMPIKLQDFERLAELLCSDNVQAKTLAVVGLRKLLSLEQQPPFIKVLDKNLIPVLLEVSKSGQTDKIQFEAIWCLTNIASGESMFVLKLVECNAITVLVEVINSNTSIEVKEQAIWCLGNISGDNSQYRDVILHTGVADQICMLLDKSPPGTSFIRNSSWTLANFCKGNPPTDIRYLERAIFSLHKVMCENDNEEILTDIAWSFSYVTDEGGDDRIMPFINANVAPRLLALLNHPNNLIAVPCLRTLGNILTASDDIVQSVLDNGFMETITVLLDHPKKAIRKEICWTISNITAGSVAQIQRCVNNGILKKLVSMMLSPQESEDIKKEAVWALSNATVHASLEQIRHLVEAGILQAFGQILGTSDVNTLIVTLEGINFLLKWGQKNLNENGENEFVRLCETLGVLDKFEALQLHENESVYNKVIKIMETYFVIDDNNDLMNLLATSSADQAPGGISAQSLWGDVSQPADAQFQL